MMDYCGLSIRLHHPIQFGVFDEEAVKDNVGDWNYTKLQTEALKDPRVAEEGIPNLTGNPDDHQ